jgi:hypothetical protein
VSSSSSGFLPDEAGVVPVVAFVDDGPVAGRAPGAVAGPGGDDAGGPAGAAGGAVGDPAGLAACSGSAQGPGGAWAGTVGGRGCDGGTCGGRGDDPAEDPGVDAAAGALGRTGGVGAPCAVGMVADGPG